MIANLLFLFHILIYLSVVHKRFTTLLVSAKRVDKIGVFDMLTEIAN